MPYHVVERLDRRVMHVGCAQCHGAKRRRLEGKVQRLLLHLATASLVGGRGTDVVEFVIGKSPSAVAGEASGLAREQRESTLRRIRDRLLIAFDPAVKGSNRGFQRTFEGGDSLNNSIDIDWRSRQFRLEFRHIIS